MPVSANGTKSIASNAASRAKSSVSKAGGAGPGGSGGVRSGTTTNSNTNRSSGQGGQGNQPSGKTTTPLGGQGNVNTQSAFSKMNNSTQSGLGLNAPSTGLSRMPGGISTPMASGSPLNNPVGINVTPGNNSLKNALTQRQAVRSMTPQAGERVTDVFGPSYAMDPSITGRLTSRPSVPAGQKVTDVFGPNYAQDPSIAGRLNAPQPANVVNSGKYLSGRFGQPAVEDLTRPDLANPSLNTGDWSYDAATGVKTPVYNGLTPGAVPTPRVSPLKQSPVMRTPQGDVKLWSPTDNFKAPTTPEGQAMMRDMQVAAFNTGTLVQPFSGVAGRKTGTKNHPSGNAIDVNIIDPKTGKAQPNFQNAGSYPSYENYAQAVRTQQQVQNPELDNKLRWGGYFTNRGKATGGTAADQMHFDVSPQFGGAMAGGSWAEGPTPQMAAQWGGTGPNQPPSAYTVAMNKNPTKFAGEQTVAPGISPASYTDKPSTIYGGGISPSSLPSLANMAVSGVQALSNFKAPDIMGSLNEAAGYVKQYAAAQTGLGSSITGYIADNVVAREASKAIENAQQAIKGWQQGTITKVAAAEALDKAKKATTQVATVSENDPSMWESTTPAQQASIRQDRAPTTSTTTSQIASLLQGNGKAPKFGQGGQGGLRNLAKGEAPKVVAGPTEPSPGFTWVQWTPGSPPTQIPTSVLVGAA